MNNYVSSQLTVIKNTYDSMAAFFYQKIPQKKFTNNKLKTYVIDYSLLLPSSAIVDNLNTNQVSAQLKSYADLCKGLIQYIDTTFLIQKNIFFEQIENVLDNSITQISEFALSLLNAKHGTLYIYKTIIDMGFGQALYINKISLDQYELQAALNYNLTDFNNIPAGTSLVFTKGDV